MSVTLKPNQELAYRREVYFAVELLDAVTMTRISNGVKIEAEGLQAKPILNAGGCFVWLKEGDATAKKISVDPDKLPFEKAEIKDVKLPLTTIELQPAVNYEFAAGITGLRGTLIERPAVPIGNAEVKINWLSASSEESNNTTWKESPTTARTDDQSGDFVSFLRLGEGDNPDVSFHKEDDPHKTKPQLSVQLSFTRNKTTLKSEIIKLPRGRIKDPTKGDPLTFVWNDLQP